MIGIFQMCCDLVLVLILFVPSLPSLPCLLRAFFFFHSWMQSEPAPAFAAASQIQQMHQHEASVSRVSVSQQVATPQSVTR
jgi:hypothetical protein